MRLLRAGLAVVATVAALVLFIWIARPLDSSAPPMTESLARSLLQQASASFERGDTTGVLDLIAPDADVFGHSRDGIAEALVGLKRDPGSKYLRFGWSQPSVSGTGANASISVTLDLLERSGRMEAHYLHLPLSLDLSKRQETGLGGLRTTERWKVVRASSPTQLDLDFWIP